jgi:murein DD-endopeptidase MepM/ murein hydrolase activator NlpD
MTFTLPVPRRGIRPLVLLLLLTAWLPRVAAAQAQYHVVEKGETLYSIARSYGVKAEAIAKANAIDDPYKLRVGARILIPRDGNTNESLPNDTAASGKASSDSAPAEILKYKVVKGDTLFSIAKTYGLSLDALRSTNKLKTSSVIKPGDTISIPTEGKAIPTVAEPATAISEPAADPAPRAAAPPPGPPASSGGGAAPALPEAVKTTAKAVSKSLSWPCSGQILYLDGKAYGVLIRSKLGESMKSVADGTVSSAGPYRGYGNVVFVLSRGYIYVYGGNESISVRAGDHVAAGQEIGKVGIDAKQGVPAAYFLVFKNGSAVDPAAAPRD